MSIALAKLLFSETRPLQELRSKILAIDIMPWLYKYLYAIRSKDHQELGHQSIKTSHLKGFLNFLKNLSSLDIKPIICLDGSELTLKRQTIKKRKQAKTRVLDKLSLLTDSNLALTQDQKRLKRNAQIYISQNEKDTIICCCQYLGVPYYYLDGIEGEKACAFLKRNGIADECLTTDRDALLYGVSFYSQIDFKTKSLKYYDYLKNLDSLYLTDLNQFICAAICTGCDYTDGLKGIGPKKILTLIKDKPKLNQLIEAEIPNYNQIYELLSEDISPEGLVKTEPNPAKLVQLLKNLNFNQDYILNLCSFLFRS